MARPIKFLLIKPTVAEWRVGGHGVAAARTQLFRYSMLSSLYVAAAMPPCVTTRLLDEETEPIDFDTDADLIGLTFMTCNAPRAYEIAGRFRRKGKTIIAGGYHPTFLPGETLQHVDAVCLGEAETVVERMVADYQRGALQPVYAGGLADLTQLPLPDRSLIHKTSYAGVDAIQATRGCPHRCSFCSITSFFRHAFRRRPIEEVVRELRVLGRTILFMDDNLTADPEYAKELFARMIPLRKIWFSQCGVQIAADPELLTLAARSGCRGLFIGFESLSDENLRHWRKNCNRQRDYARVVRALHAQGIGVCAALVFGYDWDTEEAFPQALGFLESARVDALQATILTPFPGTELFSEMERQGRMLSLDWSRYDFNHVVFEPRHLSAAMLKRGHDWVLTRFYSRRAIAARLLRQLAYLSPFSIGRITAPLNLSYRHRLRANGTLLPGRAPLAPGRVETLRCGEGGLGEERGGLGSETL